MSFFAILDVRLTSSLRFSFLVFLPFRNKLDDDKQSNDIEEDHCDDPTKGDSNHLSFCDAMIVKASGCPSSRGQPILVQTHNLNYVIFTIKMQSAVTALLLLLFLCLFLSNNRDFELCLSTFIFSCCRCLAMYFWSFIGFFCLFDAE